MELPIGQLALDLIAEIETAIKTRENEIATYKGAIEGVKLLVGKLQTHAESVQAPAVLKEVTNGNAQEQST
jgi:hypothetical protein